MKKQIMLTASLILLSLFGFSQGAGMQNLIGQWEFIGINNEGGRLEIIDSSNIIISKGGEKKSLNNFKMDFTKSPIWFDFIVKDSTDTMQVKSIIEIISDDIIKWQVFMNEERMNHFTVDKGEMFYLKRIKKLTSALAQQ